jgi:peptidoglycan/xylan/chitin deacetylase (PgdA/CDA1 family)
MRSLRAGFLATALIAVAATPFAAASARAGDAAAGAAMPVPPQATLRVAVENSTPVPTDRTPVPLQTTVLSSAQDQAPTTTASTAKAETPKTETPKAETPKAETPNAAETPAAETPKPETPKQETSKPEPGKPDTAATPAADGKPDSKDTKPDTAAAQPATPAQAAASDCPGNPNALGTSRVLAIDPADLKRIGHMQYPDSLPLQDKEVVITFDDGPIPPYSNQILDILASQCVKVTYFLVGEMARAYPSIVRHEYEAGHTIGTHSEHHPLHFGELPLERMRSEIDVGISDVAAALGDTKYMAPFFRIPGLDRSNLLEEQLAARHLIVFSSDTLADDWRRIGPEQIRSLALKRLTALGKGILLLHDIHAKTVAALPGILKDLKDNGFRIVQVVPSASYEIAMASKPRAHPPMLASAMPEQLKVSSGIDAAAKPTWPQPTMENPAPEVAALPAPDASDFQPDTGVNDEAGNVQWPDQPKATGRAADSDEDKSERTSHHARHRKHDSDSAEHENRHHRRGRAGGDGHRADLVTKIKALAGLFTPAH